MTDDAHRFRRWDAATAVSDRPSMRAAALEAALSAVSEGIVIQDKNGAVTSCNPASERILGLTADQMMGATPVDPRWRAIREDGSPFPRGEQSAMATLRSGRPLQGVIMGVYQPDGSLSWISINSVPFRAGNDGAGEDGVVTSLTDVTERRRIEADLRASEERFRTGVGVLLDGFAICSPVRDEDGEIIDFRWEYANDASCRRNRLTREQMIGHRIGDVIPGYPASKLFEQHRRVAQTGEAETVAELWFEGEWAGGEQVSTAYEGTVVPLGPNIIITARDITERNLAELELRRLAALVESSADAILSTDCDWRIDTWNRGAERLYGYAASEIVGQPVSRLVPAERAGEEQAILTRVLGGEYVEGYETQCLAKDGSVLDVWITVSPIRNAAGEIIGASAVHRDVSRQKRMREELSKSEALLRGGFEHSPIGMMLTNLDGTFDRVNGAFARILGYDDPQELAGVDFASLTHPDDVAENREGIRAMLEQDQPYLAEKRYLRRDGTTVHVILGSTAVRDDAGNPIAFFTQVEDITDRKRSEEQLRSSEERFRVAAESMLDAFIIVSPVRDDDGQITDFRYRHVNDAYCGLVGFDRGRLLGHQVGEVFPQFLGSERFELYRRVALTGEPCRTDEVQVPSTWAGTALAARVLDTVIASMGEGLVVVARDITEAKRAEAELAQLRSLLERTQQISKTGGWEYDVATGRLTWTDEVYRIYGIERTSDPTEVAPAVAAYDRESAPIISAAFERLVADGEPYDLELGLVRDDGRRIWVRTIGRPQIEGGRVVRVGGLIADITERKEAEQELRLRAELLDLAHDAVIVREPIESRVTFWSRGAETIYGYSHADAVGRITHELLATVSPESKEAVDEALAREGGWDGELRHTRKDGTVIVVSSRQALARDADGGPVAIIELNSDISERKQVEQERERALAELQEAQQIAQLGSWYWDPATETRTWSAGMYEVYGRNPAGGPIGTDQSFAWVHEDDLERVKRAYARMIDSGERFELDYRLLTGDRGMRTVHAIARPDPDHPGSYRGTLQDVTALREAEEKVRTLNAELEQRVAVRTADLERANRELETFAYSVSHDLRAPLRAVNAFSQLLRDECGDEVGEEGRHYLERVRAGAVRMGELIDAVLELSRLSRRRIVRTRVDLSALASEIVAELQRAEPDRRVEVEIQDGLLAEADLALVRTVLQNLLANAYKFTSHTPHPRVHFGAVDDSGVPVYFVADNGAGFEMAHAKRLFLPFHRLHQDSEFPGEGIGLATVVRAVHRHGGVVWAHGAVNHGATLYFSLMHGAQPPADAVTGEDVIPAWQPTQPR